MPLFTGSPAYDAKTTWRPFPALVVTLLVFFASTALGVGLALLAERLDILGWIAGDGGADASGPDASSDIGVSVGVMLAAQLLLQVLVVAGVWYFAGFGGQKRTDVLALRAPEGGISVYFIGIGLILLVSAVYSAIAFSFVPEAVKSDLGPFIEILRMNGGLLLGLAVAIGAPLSEEFLFRGFLLPALAKTRLGFWGAAVISTSLWCGLHAQYSLAGLGIVFLIGLLLSWQLWRTGSLWVPIVCHGVYNALVFLVLWGITTGAIPAT